MEEESKKDRVLSSYASDTYRMQVSWTRLITAQSRPAGLAPSLIHVYNHAAERKGDHGLQISHLQG